MYQVYIPQDEAGRHYIGMMSDLEARLEQHRRGGTQTTRRMKGMLSLVAKGPMMTKTEALQLERKLKNWKAPLKAIALLQSL